MRIPAVQRGEVYRVAGARGEPKPTRVYIVVSRQNFLDTNHSTVACVPIYSHYHGLNTEVLIDESYGIKHLSAAHCDQVTSLPRALLRAYVGSLSATKMREVSRAMAVALDILPEDIEDL